MKIFHARYSLRTRFIVGMLGMYFLLFLGMLGTIWSLQDAIEALEEVAEEIFEELNPTVQVQIRVLKAAMPPNNFFIGGNPLERENWISLSESADSAFAQVLTAPFGREEEKLLIQSSVVEWQKAKQIAGEIFAIPHPKEYPLREEKMGQFDAHIDRAIENLSGIYNHAREEIEKEMAYAVIQKRRVLYITLSIFGLGLAIAFGGSLLLMRDLSAIDRLRKGVQQLGKGNLSHRVKLNRKDELGQLAGIFNDMADKLGKTQAMLEDLAIHDSLTNLYNHREFYRKLKGEIQRFNRYGHTFSLLMLDFDNFKAVNDNYGHQAGDTVLQTIAALIKKEIRPSDHIARYGGEEFAIILPETSESSSIEMANRIKDFVANHKIIISPEKKISVTVSIGVAIFPKDGESDSDIVLAADSALYSAKVAGRNLVCRYG